MATTTTETGNAGATALIQLMLDAHTECQRAIEALTPTNLMMPSLALCCVRDADAAITELARLLLPAVAAAMGEDLEALAAD